MQTILKKLNETLNVAEVRLKKCEQQMAVNAQLKSALDNEKIELDARDEALTKREKSVTIYEDLATAKKNIEDEKEANINARNNLNHEKALFEDKKAKDAEELSGAKAMLEQQKDKVRKQAEELIEEKKNYKQGILNEINKQMSK